MTDTIDWNYFISKYGRKWVPSPIRGLFPLENLPGMISFLAGKPNPTTFPFSELSITLKPVIPGQPAETLKLDGDALNEGLQYTATAGIGGLVKWLEDLTVETRGRKKDGSWRISLGSGSQDLINKAFSSLVDDGDSILLEAPVYSGTLGLLKPYDVFLAEVPVDTQGLDPSALSDILSNWSTKYPSKRFPKILYTIPTGSNPTGCSCPLERKIKVLELARKYNLLILEDDAYHFLHFNPSEQAPSYFELEGRDGKGVGRVVRFDSFSKILSSGMRIGFVTAAPELVTIMDLNTANTNLQVSSTTQAIVLVLLEKWGLKGFLEHCRRVADFYKMKRDMFDRAAHKHLDGLATWVLPDSGMFLFLALSLPSGDSSALISQEAVKKGVLGIPGVSFMPSGRMSNCMRVSYSLATEEDAEEGFKRLRECLEEVQEK